MLSEKVQELIKKSRIVSFENWHNYQSEVIAIFKDADDQGRFLTQADIEKISNYIPSLSNNLQQGKILHDHATEIVSAARGVVLKANPDITEPGGGLYPPMRAEACWRDFWHFLRCISYGISGGSIDYISDRGMDFMEQLYQELQVPLEAMVLGLEQLKIFSLEKFPHNQQADLEPYFDRLIESMRKFS